MSATYETPFTKTARRGAPSRSIDFIIDTNGALPVPVEMKRWVRSSSGSRVNLPFGPIMRMPWPTAAARAAA